MTIFMNKKQRLYMNWEKSWRSNKRRFVLSIPALILFSIVMIILHNLFSAIWGESSMPSGITFILAIISLMISGITIILSIISLIQLGIRKIVEKGFGASSFKKVLALFHNSTNNWDIREARKYWIVKGRQSHND